MKMIRQMVIGAAFVIACLTVVAQADVLNMGSGLTSLEMVTVGDPGNAADTCYGTHGAVGYSYQIGKYEVTTAQYTEFLNAVAATDTYGLYNPNMAQATVDRVWGCNIQQNGSSGSYSYSVASDWANRPVNYVSFWDACRFVNWLYNGQGSGSTETGVYTLGGYNGDDGRTIQRNPGTGWWLPSDDEWYKAAFYKGNGTNSGYWLYPTQSNSVPTNQVLPTDPGDSANYLPVLGDYILGDYSIGSPYYRTNVGEFENSASAYGTFDQAGNVWEWNEAVSHYDYRGLRGGSFGNRGSDTLSAAGGSSYYPSFEFMSTGFRIAGAVPEPSPLIALLGGVAVVLRRKRCTWRIRR